MTTYSHIYIYNDGEKDDDETIFNSLDDAYKFLFDHDTLTRLGGEYIHTQSSDGENFDLTESLNEWAEKNLGYYDYDIEIKAIKEQNYV